MTFHLLVYICGFWHHTDLETIMHTQGLVGQWNWNTWF